MNQYIAEPTIEYFNAVQPGVELPSDSNVYLWMKGVDNSQMHFTGKINCTIPSAVIAYVHAQNTKESFYITAIKNLMKKNSYLQLSLDLSHACITSEEFKDEIKRNRGKYVISLAPLRTPESLNIIAELIAKISEEEMSTDDVGELLSITPDSLGEGLRALGY